MPMLLLRSTLFGIVGLVAIPVIAFFGVLALAYGAGGCGPGDSGGCEMSAGVIGMAVALPAFAIFFFVTLIRGLMRRKAPASPPPPPEPQ